MHVHRQSIQRWIWIAQVLVGLAPFANYIVVTIQEQQSYPVSQKSIFSWCDWVIRTQKRCHTKDGQNAEWSQLNEMEQCAYGAVWDLSFLKPGDQNLDGQKASLGHFVKLPFQHPVACAINVIQLSHDDHHE